MKYKILHIEDSKADADLVKRLIQRSGINFTYQLATDKNEAIEALNSFEPNIILCDHSLPSFNSKMAYVLCKEKNLNLPFILVTGTVSEEFAVEMLKMGVDDYLLKSNLQRLPTAITNALAKKETENKIQSFRSELHKSETNLRIIFENSSVGLVLLDRNGTILELNDRTKHYNKISFGRELEINGNLLESVPAYRREDLQAKFEKSLQGEKIQFESVYPQQNGTIITFDVKLSPTLDGYGKVTGACMTFEDISERKRAEQALKASELFNRSILSSIDYQIAVVEENGNIIAVNNAWNDFALKNGVTSLDRAGIGSNYIAVSELAAEAGDGIAEKALKGFEQVSKKEIPFFEMEYPCHSLQEQRWFLLRIVNFADDSPKVVMMHIDISYLKKAGEELKNITNRLLLATNSAGMGIWDWDIKKDHLLWDDGMYRLYKINDSHFGSIYNAWLSRLHPEDSERVNQEIQMAITGKKQYDTEFRIIWEDLSVHYIKATGLTEIDGEGNIIRLIGVNWDITALKAAELNLKELNENLQTHSKQLAISNAELEQFAYVASHDLQEPLRMVTSFLTLLEQKYSNVIDDKGKNYIGFAVDGAKRMRQIILDLLEYSRAGKKEEDKEELDLNDLLNEIKILLRKKIEEKKAVFIIDQLPHINTHRSPLRQVFQNLISNALKYSSDEISVEVHITVRELKDHWQFAVADNGIGIETEYFEKIFIIFQRLHNKDEYSGTGMGLAITKKIIEKLGGKIWVESKEGKGSTFYFTIAKY